MALFALAYLTAGLLIAKLQGPYSLAPNSL